MHVMHMKHVTRIMPPLSFGLGKGGDTAGLFGGPGKRCSSFSGLRCEHTLPELTYDLKMDGGKTSFLRTWPIFSGHLGFREDTQVFSNTSPPIRFWMMYVKNFPVCSHQDAVWKDTGGQLQGARC